MIEKENTVNTIIDTMNADIAQLNIWMRLSHRRVLRSIRETGAVPAGLIRQTESPVVTEHGAQLGYVNYAGFTAGQNAFLKSLPAANVQENLCRCCLGFVDRLVRTLVVDSNGNLWPYLQAFSDEEQAALDVELGQYTNTVTYLVIENALTLERAKTGQPFEYAQYDFNQPANERKRDGVVFGHFDMDISLNEVTMRPAEETYATVYHHHERLIDARFLGLSTNWDAAKQVFEACGRPTLVTFVQEFQKLQQVLKGISDYAVDARQMAVISNNIHLAVQYPNSMTWQVLADLSNKATVEDLKNYTVTVMAKVDPAKYRRATVEASEAELQAALKDLTDRGLLPALERRMALITDIADSAWLVRKEIKDDAATSNVIQQLINDKAPKGKIAAKITNGKVLSLATACKRIEEADEVYVEVNNMSVGWRAVSHQTTAVHPDSPAVLKTDDGTETGSKFAGYAHRGGHDWSSITAQEPGLYRIAGLVGHVSTLNGGSEYGVSADETVRSLVFAKGRTSIMEHTGLFSENLKSDMHRHRRVIEDINNKVLYKAKAALNADTRHLQSGLLSTVSLLGMCEAAGLSLVLGKDGIYTRHHVIDVE